MGIAASLALAACDPGKPPEAPRSSFTEASPLGPGYVLIPAPSEDDSLLGRVLTAVPEAGRSLDEISQPNPCLEKLTPAKTSAMANSIENAEDLSMRAKAAATLGAFGFSADAGRATHLFYKLSTNRQVSRSDTIEYQQCCKEKSCGYGYVAALVQGEGEYASAEETRGSAQVQVALSSAGGDLRLRVLRKRNVRGYLAALVRVTDATMQKATLDPIGGMMKATGMDAESLPQRAREVFERERVLIDGTSSGFVFRAGEAKVPITENDFVRRYKRATGSDELDYADGRRNKGMIAAFGIPALVSAGFLIYGLSDLPWARPDPENSKVCGELSCGATIAGAIGLAGAGAMLGIAWFSDWKDGAPSDHTLTAYDAQLAVSRYNRQLLRKAYKDLQGQQSRLEPLLPSMRFGLGPGSLQLEGRF